MDNIRQVVLSAARSLAAPLQQQLGEAKLYRRMAVGLEYMRDRWRGVGKQPYANAECRLAFLCSHVPVHADSLAWFMQHRCYTVSRFLLRRLDETGRVRVWSLGGGPGTELLALCRQLSRLLPERPAGEPLPRLEYVTHEAEAGWQPVFDRVAAEAASRIGLERRFRLDPAPAFVHAPIGHPLPLVEPADLYVLSYVLSENPAGPGLDGLVAALGPVRDGAPDHSLFVLTDMWSEQNNPFPAAKDFLVDRLHLAVQYPRPAGYGDIPYDGNHFNPHEPVEQMAEFNAGINANNWSLRGNSQVYWLAASKAAVQQDFQVE